MDLMKELENRHTSINMCSKTTGIPYGALYPIIKGRVDLDKCNYGTLKKLAAYFACSIDDLYPAEQSFSVYWRNEKTADVYIEETKVKIFRYVIHPVKQIFAHDEISRMELGIILQSRCWDEHRDHLDSYLKKLGVDSYNPYAICRKTHGVMFQDHIWFKYQGEELTWEDVRVR